MCRSRRQSVALRVRVVLAPALEWVVIRFEIPLALLLVLKQDENDAMNNYHRSG